MSFGHEPASKFERRTRRRTGRGIEEAPRVAEKKVVRSPLRYIYSYEYITTALCFCTSTVRTSTSAPVAVSTIRVKYSYFVRVLYEYPYDLYLLTRIISARRGSVLVPGTKYGDGSMYKMLSISYHTSTWKITSIYSHHLVASTTSTLRYK